MEDKDFECFPYASSNVVGPFLREAKVLNASLTLACPSIIASTFFSKIWKISSEHCLKIPDLIFENKSCWWWRNALTTQLKEAFLIGDQESSNIFKQSYLTFQAHNVLGSCLCHGRCLRPGQLSPAVSWADVSYWLLSRCLTAEW